VPANPAVIDGTPPSGKTASQFAASGRVEYVMFEYLTIRNYVAPVDSNVVNQDGANNWVIKYNTIGPNSGIDDAGNVVAYNAGGGGLGVGQNEIIQYNCFTRNGQYGINGGNGNCTTPIPGGGCKVFGIVIDHNEFSEND